MTVQGAVDLKGMLHRPKCSLHAQSIPSGKHYAFARSRFRHRNDSSRLAEKREPSHPGAWVLALRVLGSPGKPRSGTGPAHALCKNVAVKPVSRFTPRRCFHHARGPCDLAMTNETFRGPKDLGAHSAKAPATVCWRVPTQQLHPKLELLVLSSNRSNKQQPQPPQPQPRPQQQQQQQQQQQRQQQRQHPP